MKIEDFGVSRECIDALLRNGVTEVWEIVEFLEGCEPGNTFTAHWLFCFPEILNQIKRLGLWSEKLEQNWPSNDQIPDSKS